MSRIMYTWIEFVRVAMEVLGMFHALRNGLEGGDITFVAISLSVGRSVSLSFRLFACWLGELVVSCVPKNWFGMHVLFVFQFIAVIFLRSKR